MMGFSLRPGGSGVNLCAGTVSAHRLPNFALIALQRSSHADAQYFL